MASNLPAGFVLDQQPSQLPPGFVLDSVSQSPMSAIANSGMGKMVNYGVTNAADVMGDIINPAIGGRYKDQVQTPDLNTISQAAAATRDNSQGFFGRVASGASGAWNNTTWPQKLGAVEESLMSSPTGKVMGMFGASPQGAAIGAGLNTVNQAAENNLGIPHQLSQGVEAIASPFLAKPIGNMVDSATNAIRSIPETMANNSKNLLLNNQGGNRGELIPVSTPIKQTLFADSPDLKTYMGDALGQRLQGAEQSAFTDKNLAYQAANPALATTSIGDSTAMDLSGALKAHAASFDPELVPAAKSVADYADALSNKNTRNPTINENLGMDSKNPQVVSLEDIEGLRKRLNAIPVKDSATGNLVGGAKAILDSKMDEYLQNGLVNGDPQALKLIQDARSKNAYWRQNFSSSDANKAIRTFIEKSGGPEQIAPENLVDMFTRVGQVGLDNVKAMKSVLGDEATPILKTGYLNKMRTESLDQNGNIMPLKLQKSINTLLNNNPSLANYVFSPEEIQGLQGISNVAGTFSRGGVAPKGVIGSIVTKIPVAGPLFKDFINQRAQAKMIDNIAHPRTQ